MLKKDLSNKEDGYDTFVRFESKVNITMEFLKDGSNQYFLKSIINGKNDFQVELCYANDPGMVYNTVESNVSICLPKISSYEAVPYSPENAQVTPNLVKVAFRLEDCSSNDLPLYCHLYQADVTNMVRLKNRNRANGIFLCKKDPLNPNQWFFMLKPSEFVTKKIAFGMGDEEMSFKICFDQNGDLPLEFKENIRDDGYTRKFNKEMKYFVKPFKWPK